MSSNKNLKREFIRRILEKYRHDDRGVNYLLKFILEHDELLNNIEFTEHSNYAPRGLYISFLLDGEQSFVYFKDELAYFYQEQAFHDLRLHQQEQYFVEIVLPERDLDELHGQLIVANPYSPDYIIQQNQVESYLDHLTQSVYIQKLERQINKALETQDFALMDKLVLELERYRGEVHDYRTK
ncbi:YpiB family protein [Aerococcaceae bacterium DSM 111022]|nr:YpiB family protein [Aerococcaceae bacterium DSM 111022]